MQREHWGQWKRAENPEINLYIYSQLFFDKCAELIESGKDCLFKKCAKTTGYPETKE